VTGARPRPTTAHVALVLVHVLVLGAGVLAASRSPAADDAPAGAAAVGTSSPRPSAARTAPAPRPGAQVAAEDHGAVGDGRADDGPALQRGLDALQPGQVLVLASGRTYRHAQVLTLTRPDTGLIGPGELLAADEERSALQLQAARTRVTDLVLRIAGTTRRWTAREQHRVVLGAHGGLAVARVRVEGSAGAGIFVEGASSFTIDDATVVGTRADGIHMTGGSVDGRVSRPVVSDTGDDGIAVVSYQSDDRPTRGITVEAARVLGTRHGRGISVVGGEDVVYRDVQVERSNSAGVYVATEGAPYFTSDTRRVTVDGAVLIATNTNADIDHGAVLISAAAQGRQVTDVTVTDVVVRDTRPGASRQIGVLSYGGDVADVLLRDIAVIGGGPLFQSTVDQAAVQIAGWTRDQRPVTDPREEG
jgi:polygalacturonase